MKKMTHFFSLLLIFLLFSSQTATKPFDYLLINGTVYDGKSEESQRIDIGIQGERIVALGQLSGMPAQEILDLRGLILQPGIIDAHTHSDFTALLDSNFEHALRQGVTTIVVGNCGMGAYPVTSTNFSLTQKTWSREGVQIPSDYAARDFLEYASLIAQKKPKINLVPLAAHGNIRNALLGFQPRPLSLEERQSEVDLLQKNFKQGAFGLSFGLAYLPGIYAERSELIELAKAAHEQDRIVTVHMRSEGSELEENVRLVIQLAEESGATFVISHFKANGIENWSKFYPVLNLIKKARREGLSLYISVYPYEASQTELASVLPKWFYSDPEREKILESSERREHLIRSIEETQLDTGKLLISVVASKRNKQWEGQTVQDYARSKNVSEPEGLLRLLEEENFDVTVFSFKQHYDLVKEALRQEFSMIVTDTIVELSDHPHPRAFGTFPKFLREMSLENSDLSLGEAIRKITSLPARVYKIKDRGEIREGAFADLIIWDPNTYQTKSTYENSRVLAEGVQDIFVNGQPVLRGSRPTQHQPGKVLKRLVREA